MANGSPRGESEKESIRRYQRNLTDEMDGVAMYRLLAEAEEDPRRREVLEQLAETEGRHAEIWRQKLRKAGVQPKGHTPSLRVRLLGFLARRFGLRAVLPIVRGMEAGAYASYMTQDETARSIAPDEREHRRALARMVGPRRESAEGIARGEEWHRLGGGGTLRATMFGMSDGLVSNASLVMGFAGAQTEGKFVLLAGVAGLLAGAFSMAAGEYVSMQSQRELFERQIELESQELEMAPQEEERELALIYRAKGLPAEQAEAMAARLMENPQIALETLVREELGLDPSELGSPWGAASGSFLAFAVGALIPVIPFFFGANASAPYVVASALLSALALATLGGMVSLLTGRSPLWSAVRQLGLGVAAAALTFAIGRIIGVSAGV